MSAQTVHNQILFMKPLLDGHKLKVRFHSLTFKHPVKARLLTGSNGAPFDPGTVAPGTSPETDAAGSTAAAALIPMPVFGQSANESFIDFDNSAELIDVLHESGQFKRLLVWLRQQKPDDLVVAIQRDPYIARTDAYLNALE
jgi:hypothetical protein